MPTARDRTIETPPGHPRHEEERLDEAIDETFPASDPVSISIDDPKNRERPAPADLPPGAKES